MTNSNLKGKTGEREFAAFLRLFGFEARRGQQYSGGGDSPDVVHSVPGIHFEVKRVEKAKLYPWLEQAKNDACGGAIPVVAHRQNRQEWVAILSMDDFLRIISDDGYAKGIEAATSGTLPSTQPPSIEP